MTRVSQELKDKAVALYIDEKLSPRDIGKKLGISPAIIRNVVIKSGNKIRSVSESLHLKKSPITDPGEIKKIIDRYKSGEYQHVIAKDYNTNQSVLRKLLIRYAGESVLRTRDEVDDERLQGPIDKLKELHKRYMNDESLTVKSLAEEIGIKMKALNAAFVRNDLPLRDNHDAAATTNRVFTDNEVKKMVRLHKIEGKTLSDIVRQHNADVATTSRSLKVLAE